MDKSSRPLSPHLQIYKPQLTSVLSITHRGTGVFLCLGAVVLVYWLAALAGGPETYAAAQALLGAWPGKLLLLGFTFAVFFHLCNGVRHLFWDAGAGFEINQVYASGAAVIVASAILTASAWLAAYALR